MTTLLCGFLILCSPLIAESALNEDKKSDWYTRYSAYPEYCSTPEQLKEREIPPLQGSSLGETTKLLHVTTVIRHGARTPWSGHACWDGYWESNETGIWDCELTTMTSPPAPPEIFSVENDPSSIDDTVQLDGEGAMFLFEKRYDALQSPPQLTNELNGTCQVGQLLLRGYAQELSNGRMLRKTYVKDDHTLDFIDDSMVLFDLDSNDYNGEDGKHRPYEEPHLFYRADDDQRTIMSGQVLLRGLFGDLIDQHAAQLASNQSDPTIVMHTADRYQDILSSNSYICPRLNDLKKEAEKSEGFVKEFTKSDESKAMRQLVSDLGGDFEHGGEGQDCLMTAICNDHTLPDLVNNFVSDDDNGNFKRLDRFSYRPYNYVLGYNNAAYAKLSMGPLWASILQHLKSGSSKKNEPKLAVFAAHDTTILSLLATLGSDVWDGGKDWAPYASMLVFEIHEILEAAMTSDIHDAYPSKKAFRLIYNGKVLTGKFPGCQANAELCDLSVLMDLVSPFALEERDCDSSLVVDEENSCTRNVFSSWENIVSLLLTMVISGCIGSLITFMVLTRRFPNFGRRKVSSGEGRYDMAAKDWDGGHTVESLDNSSTPVVGIEASEGYGAARDKPVFTID